MLTDDIDSGDLVRLTNLAKKGVELDVRLDQWNYRLTITKHRKLESVGRLTIEADSGVVRFNGCPVIQPSLVPDEDYFYDAWYSLCEAFCTCTVRQWYQNFVKPFADHGFEIWRCPKVPAGY